MAHAHGPGPTVGLGPLNYYNHIRYKYSPMTNSIKSRVLSRVCKREEFHSLPLVYSWYHKFNFVGMQFRSQNVHNYVA